jgi:PAS domain S-box-containing protein
MSSFECVKQLLKPTITIWQSHSITIIFSSIVATVTACFVLKKYEEVNNWLRNEIDNHRRAELEMTIYRENLEKMVEKNTAELMISNHRLQENLVERAHIVESLKSSEERHRNLVESINDWVWETDEKFVITFSCPRVKDILGYEPCEILGKPLFKLMLAEEAGGISVILDHFASFRQPFAFIENINLHKAGHQVALESGGVPILGKDGDLRGYRGISRDISDRKLVEDALRESEATLRGFFNSNAIQMSVIELDGDDFIFVIDRKSVV